AERPFFTRITHPDASNVSRRVTEEPNVGVIVYSAGLSSDRNRKRVRCSRSSPGHDAAHHRNHRQGNVFIHHLESSSLPLFQCRTITIENFANQVRLNANTFVWKRRIRRYHLIERHFSRT